MEWITRMRASMAQLTPRFSTNRVVREYTEQYYLPAATAYRARAADGGTVGAQLVTWRRAITAHWPEARFGRMKVEAHGAARHVTIPVYLGALDPEAVRVELYADPINGGEPERHAMERGRKADDSGQGHEYGASIPATRPLDDYTPRLLPHHPMASVPLEAPEILWQR